MLTARTPLPEAILIAPTAVSLAEVISVFALPEAMLTAVSAFPAVVAELAASPALVFAVVA